MTQTSKTTNNKTITLKVTVPENLGAASNDRTFEPLEDALWQICIQACETPAEAGMLLRDFEETIIEEFLDEHKQEIGEDFFV